MAVYAVHIKLKTIDPEKLEEYRSHRPELMKYKYGGEEIAISDHIEVLTGDLHPERVMVLKFPSMEQFRALWNSPEYVATTRLRGEAMEESFLLFEVP